MEEELYLLQLPASSPEPWTSGFQTAAEGLRQQQQQAPTGPELRGAPSSAMTPLSEPFATSPSLGRSSPPSGPSSTFALGPFPACKGRSPNERVAGNDPHWRLVWLQQFGDPFIGGEPHSELHYPDSLAGLLIADGQPLWLRRMTNGTVFVYRHPNEGQWKNDYLPRPSAPTEDWLKEVLSRPDLRQYPVAQLPGGPQECPQRGVEQFYKAAAAAANSGLQVTARRVEPDFRWTLRVPAGHGGGGGYVSYAKLSMRIQLQVGVPGGAQFAPPVVLSQHDSATEVNVEKVE